MAALLGVSKRTIASWHEKPNVTIRPELQRALDTAYERAPEAARTRFAMLLSGGSPSTTDAAPSPQAPPEPTAGTTVELHPVTDRRVVEALAWLDQAAGWAPGRAHQALTEALRHTNLRAIQERGFARQRITQQQIASALSAYYAEPDGDFRVFAARVGTGRVRTSVLTQPAWLDLRLPLHSADGMTFTASIPPPVPAVDPVSADAAVRRLADALTADLTVGSGRMYRLVDIQAGTDGTLAGTFSLTDFVAYSLTMDLLETELIDALVTRNEIRPGSLPLRDRYLPDLAAVLSLHNRLCAGGALALTAIARPYSRMRRGKPDYLLLVQERSGRVLNAARRLAVIPKGFHEPLSDYREDAHLAATLEREMEEELFGREDIDSVVRADQRHADPMHPSRLSEPMRWLVEHPEPEYWRMECTGFGLNLVSGNFEFASLIVIEDEEWWSRFGGHIEANWESDSLRRYSSLDAELLEELAQDGAWSNEGLFALLQGLRRLAEIGTHRVDLPTIELET